MTSLKLNKLVYSNALESTSNSRHYGTSVVLEYAERRITEIAGKKLEIDDKTPPKTYRTKRFKGRGYKRFATFHRGRVVLEPLSRTERKRACTKEQNNRPTSVGGNGLTRSHLDLCDAIMSGTKFARIIVGRGFINTTPRSLAEE